MSAASQIENSELLTEIAVYLVATCSLMLIAVNIRNTAIFGTIFGFILCSAAAYLVGVAIEICLLEATGAINGGPWLLITWAVPGITAFTIAEAAKPSGWVAVIPCCFVGALMMLGPLTANPLTDLSISTKGTIHVSLFAVNVSFAAGIAMIFFSVIAGMAVGAAAAEPADAASSAPATS